MGEHPNAVAVRRLFQALATRDAAAVNEIIPEDAVWRFPGRRGALAGDHRGRDQIISFLVSVMTLTGGTFRLDIEDITASDSNVVVLFTGRGERNGQTLTNPTALRVRMVAGRPAEIVEFVWDLENVDDFWS